MHIAIINPYNAEVEKAKVFDTHLSSEGFEDFLATEDIPNDRIIVAACKGECVKGLSVIIKKWFRNLGSEELDELEEK